MWPVLRRNDAASKVARLVSQRSDLPRIERHRRCRAAIGCKDLGNTAGKPRVAIESAFDLDQNRRAGTDEIAEIPKCHHPFAAGPERDALEAGCTELIKPGFALGKPTERIVVIDH